MRWIQPWASFVLLLAAGRVLTGEHAVPIDELVLGLPFAWLAGWKAREAGVVLLAAAGLAVGRLA